MSNYLKLRDDIELFYKKDIPTEPKGLILINHGFAEHLGRYDYLAEMMVKEGYGIYRYDLRGHGKTRSTKGHIESYVDFILDTDEMVELMKKENPHLPIFILGHSMGGFITVLYGLRYPNKIKGQILSGAAVNTLPSAKGIKSYAFEFLNLFARMKKIGNPVSNDICSVEEVVTDYKEDPLVLKEATLNFYVQFLVKGRKQITNNISNYKCPCIILHGEKDKIVPKEIAHYFYNSISSDDKELKIYENLYHEILNESTKYEVILDIINWLNARR